MKSYLNLALFLTLIALTLFTGCSDEDEKIKPTPVNELIADAGDDKIIEIGEVTTLDGSGSQDGNDQPFTYSWSAKTKPAGSIVNFSTPDDVTTSFTASKHGIYIIELKIKQGAWTATDNLVVTIKSEFPNTPSAVILSQGINFPTTLNNILEDPTQPDYIVTADIDVHADLVIMPGVVIAFQNNTGMQVRNGALIAKGNSARGIVFRGIDNTPASWKGIAIHTNSEKNEFEFVTVKQGGSTVFPETNTKANLTIAGTDIDGAAIKITNTTLEESGNYGLYVQGTSYLNSFHNNIISKNKSALFVPASQLHKLGTDTQITTNQNNAIETAGEFWYESGMVLTKLSVPYRITDDLQIRSGLTISPGVSFEIKEDVTITVTGSGYLEATGSENEKIKFTSIAENKPWNGLFINTANSRNRLQYCEISGAGKNKIPGAIFPANIAIGGNGVLKVENSVVKNSLAYAIAANGELNINQDVAFVNTFNNVPQGPVYPKKLNYLDWPSMTGVWLDRWSFTHGSNSIADDFFDATSSTWFGGAERPWEMNGAGFGIIFNEDGTFTWAIAEDGPMNGCGTFSAEYITGNMSIGVNSVTFNQNYWRSKFVNPCDESWNTDIEVDTQNITLPYDINKMYNVQTGEGYWELKFTNPDNSTFTFYRK